MDWLVGQQIKQKLRETASCNWYIVKKLADQKDKVIKLK